MQEVFERLKGVQFFETKDFRNFELSEAWSFDNAVERLLKAGEIPRPLLECIRLISTEDHRKQALLQVNQVFLFARSKFSSDIKLRKWLESGRFGDGITTNISSMAQLMALANRCLKLAKSIGTSSEKIAQQTQKLVDAPSDIKKIRSLERAEETCEGKKVDLERALKGFISAVDDLASFVGSRKL